MNMSGYGLWRSDAACPECGGHGRKAGAQCGVCRGLFDAGDRALRDIVIADPRGRVGDRPLVVGEAPATADQSLPLAGASGDRLARLAGIGHRVSLPRAGYAALALEVRLANLLPWGADADGWPPGAARAAGDLLRDALPAGTRLVALGSRVREALGVREGPPGIYRAGSFDVLSLPHPSGRSNSLNDPEVRGRCAALWREFDPPRATEINLLGGYRVDMARPDLSGIPVGALLLAVASGLAGPRWGRQSVAPLSVAQHALQVDLLARSRARALGASPREVEAAGFFGLHHDDEEGIRLDVTKPLAAVLGPVDRETKTRLRARIHARVGVPPPSSLTEQAVGWADLQSACIEAAGWVGNSGLPDPDPSAVVICSQAKLLEPLEGRVAAMRWLDRHYQGSRLDMRVVVS